MNHGAAYGSRVISEKRWETASIIQLGALVLLSLVGAISLAGMAGILLHSRLTANQVHLLQAIISMICFQGVSLIWIHFFLKRNGVTWGEGFGFAQHNYARCIGLTLIALAVVLLGLIILGNFSTWALEALHGWLGWNWLKPQPQEIVQLLGDQWPWPMTIAQGVAALVLAPLAEELLFRGVLYTAIKQRGHPHLALWASSLLFAIIHVYPAGFLSLIFLAMVLAILYDRTKNLFAPILLHSLFNSVTFFIVVAHPKWAEPLLKQ